MSTLAELRDLSNIISSAVERIEETLKAKKLDFPSLDTPFSRESETPREVPEVFEATCVITAAASRLATMVRSPAMGMIDVSFGVCASYGRSLLDAQLVYEVLQRNYIKNCLRGGRS
jgi:hypothetical protein